MYTILHKSEWERLKKQGDIYDKSTDEALSEKHEYLKALNEQSQEWIKHWPDTVAVRLNELKMQKRLLKKKNVNFIKEFTKTHQSDNADTIKNAKKMIFDDSSYGRKLISAFIESRVLKERDAQIEFKKKRQLEDIERAKKVENNIYLNVNDKEAERNRIKILKTLECNQYNDEMIQMKKDQQFKIVEKEKKCTIKCDKVMKKIILSEEQAKKEIKRHDEQGIKEYEKDRKEIAKRKALSEKLDDELIKVYKEAQNKTNCKINQVHKQVHLEKIESKTNKDLYLMLEDIQRDKNKRLDDYLESSIRNWEKRNASKELKEKELEKEKRLLNRTISEENKLRGEIDKYIDVSCKNGVCDRQTILTKTKHKPHSQCEETSNEKRAVTSEKGLSFFEPRNKLVEQLRERERKASPWNGARTAHAQFARNAAAVLKECEHKHLVYKVIDEYRRFNCLDDIFSYTLE